MVTETRRSFPGHFSLKSFPTSSLSVVRRVVPRRTFTTYGKRRSVFHPYARRQTRRRVYSPRAEESYRLPSRTTTVPGGCSLCFDFVYYSGIGPSSRRRAAGGSVLVRFSFLPHDSPSPRPRLPLHTTKPFGRYSAPSLQILYHFYEA